MVQCKGLSARVKIKFNLPLNRIRFFADVLVVCAIDLYI